MPTTRTGHAFLYVDEPSTYGDCPGFLAVCSCGWNCRDEPCDTRVETVRCWTEHAEQEMAKRPSAGAAL